MNESAAPPRISTLGRTNAEYNKTAYDVTTLKIDWRFLDVMRFHQWHDPYSFISDGWPLIEYFVYVYVIICYSVLMNMIKLIKQRIKCIVFQKTKILKKKYPQYEIGRHTYGNPEINGWDEGANLKIGAFTSIAEGVKIYLGGEHRLDWVTTYPFTALWKEGWNIKGHPKTKGDVVIGNDVWIGVDAVIMSGIKIGDGAVIGARAVVTRDVEPYSIYAGNPANLIRKRFDRQIIEQLLELAWWDFDDSEIAQLLPLMLSEKIDEFIDAANKRKKERSQCAQISDLK